MQAGDKVVLLGAAHQFVIEDLREIASGCTFLYDKEIKLENVLKEAFAELAFVVSQFQSAHQYLIVNGTPELGDYLKQINELNQPLPPNGFVELHAIDLSTYFKSFLLLAKGVLDKLVPLYSYRFNDNLKQFSDKGERLIKAIRRNRNVNRKSDMLALIGRAKKEWLDSLIVLRDQYAHYSSLGEYINFWLRTDEIGQKKIVGISDFHRPSVAIEGQAVDALEYALLVKANLIRFLREFLGMCEFTSDRRPKAYLGCEHCRYVFAKWNEKGGRRQLQVSSRGVTIAVKDREKGYGVMICPQCGGPTETDIEFWKRWGLPISSASEA